MASDWPVNLLLFNHGQVWKYLTNDMDFNIKSFLKVRWAPGHFIENKYNAIVTLKLHQNVMTILFGSREDLSILLCITDMLFNNILAEQQRFIYHQTAISTVPRATPAGAAHTNVMVQVGDSKKIMSHITLPRFTIYIGNSPQRKCEESTIHHKSLPTNIGWWNEKSKITLKNITQHFSWNDCPLVTPHNIIEFGQYWPR